MTKLQIQQLIENIGISSGEKPVLVETHISWVILTERFVYKIKKPVDYPFLNFSTLEKRKHYCEREIELNRRLTSNIYIGVVKISSYGDKLMINGNNGEIIDYAVKMNRLDKNRQMDELLKNNLVTRSDMQNLAVKIASFHKQATIIYDEKVLAFREKFNDLEKQAVNVKDKLDINHKLISDSVLMSGTFLENKHQAFKKRLGDGFFRDCHGDLHSRNIFLLPEPEPFDCIEFNDEYRQIDVLDEVAFLCMDLEVFGKKEMAEVFLEHYNKLFPCLHSAEDQQVFIFYKAFRANIRAKVNLLRAIGAGQDTEKNRALEEVNKYLNLMHGYLMELKTK